MSKRYKPKMTADWFMKRRNYKLFMIRELTSVFILAYLIVFLVFLARLGAGKEQFTAFMQTMSSGWWKALHVAFLLGAMWHSITWFNLTPKAMPLRMGEEKVPGPMVAIGMGYGPWVVVTIVILWAVCP